MLPFLCISAIVSRHNARCSQALFPATARSAARPCFSTTVRARQPGLVSSHNARASQALFPTTVHAPQPGLVFLRQCAPGSQALFPATVHARQPGLVSRHNARSATRPFFPTTVRARQPGLVSRHNACSAVNLSKSDIYSELRISNVWFPLRCMILSHLCCVSV